VVILIITKYYNNLVILIIVRTITNQQSCRLVTKETTVQTPSITKTINIIKPKVINFQGINLTFTIANINNKESKSSIWLEI